MSLVIATWDESLAVVASEGRACMKGPNGEYIPVADDRYKIRRLKDGSILGLTGDPIVTWPLRAAIEARTDVSSFNDTSVSVIPALVAQTPQSTQKPCSV